MHPAFMADALDDLADDDGYAEIRDPAEAPVRYNSATVAVVIDLPFCLAASAAMLANIFGRSAAECQARGYQAVSSARNKLRSDLHATGVI